MTPADDRTRRRRSSPGSGRGQPRPLYFVVRARRRRVHPAVDADARSRAASTSRRPGAFVLAPVHRSIHGHADRVVPSPAGGCGSWARTRCGSAGRSAWFLSALGGFPVTRGTADREALQALHRRARGAASRSCCSRRASASPARSCSRCSTAPPTSPCKAGVPIVPVGIGGSERVMPKGARFIHPRKVHVDRRRRRSAAAAADGGRVPRAAVRERHRRAARRRCSSCSTRPSARAPTG